MSNPTELPDLDRVHLLHSEEQDILLMANHHARSEDDGNYDFEAGGLLALISRAIAQYGHLARRAQPEGEEPQAEPVGYLAKWNGGTRSKLVSSKPCEWQLKEMGGPTDMTLTPLYAHPAATLSPLCGAQHAESGKEDGPLSEKMHDVVADLREFAGNPGYSHGDYADTMRKAANTIEALRAQFYHWGPDLAAQQAAAPGALDGDAAEGIELLDTLTANIAEGGNYSAEATILFLSQIRQCFAAPGNSPEIPDRSTSASGTPEAPKGGVA